MTDSIPKKSDKIIMRSVFLIACMLFFHGPLFADEMPKAMGGVLDLRETVPDESQPIPLDGEWEFYWSHLILPEQFASKNQDPIQEPSYPQFPFTWNHTTLANGTNLTPTGVATYRLTILGLPDKHRLAIRISSSDTAYRVYFNGESIMENGRVGNTGETSGPLYYAPQEVTISATGHDEIIILASNFHHSRGGLRDHILIGQEGLLQKIALFNVALDLFLAGAFVILGIYHIALYTIHKKDRSSLYFGLLNLDVTLRIMVTGEGFLYDLVGINWITGTYIEYLTFYMSLPLFLAYLRALFPDEFSKWIYYAISFITALFFLQVLFTPPIVYTDSLIYFHILISLSGLYVLISMGFAIWRNRDGSGIVLQGFAILFATLLHDMLFNFRLAGSIYISPIGLFLFFFSQAYLLSRKFSHEFQRAEDLSRNLEWKVNERTKELEKVTELERGAREASDRLLFNILPEKVARELKENGEVAPGNHEHAAILFSDFAEFTKWAHKHENWEVVSQLNLVFLQFDQICERFHVEKLKTLGDGYMAVSGVPEFRPGYAVEIVLAALQMLHFIIEVGNMNHEMTGEDYLKIRIGIHSGSVMSGVIGKNKFTYDVWGDAVNTASRIEKACPVNSIAISDEMYALVKDFFVCEEIGDRTLRSLGTKKLYRVIQLHPRLSSISDPRQPGPVFHEMIQERFAGTV